MNRTSGTPVAAYLAVHDSSYPRNRAIRQALEADGWRVAIVETGTGSYVAKTLRLITRSLLVRPAPSVVILSEFSVQFGALAWLVSRVLRVPLIVDFFVGMYETRVEDYGRVAHGSIKARLLWFLDWLALRLADQAFTDTPPRAARFTERYKSARRVIPVAVEPPVWAVPGPPSASERLEVLYYGNYIPLHGLEYVFEAARRVANPERFSFRFVGGTEGQRSAAIDRLRAADGKLRVEFIPDIPESRLAMLIADSDIVLGVFGTSPKAGEVVANKVVQGLASGRRVLTRESLALSELQELMGPLLIQVAPGDPAAIASALENASICRPSPPEVERVARLPREAARLSRDALLRRIRELADG